MFHLFQLSFGKLVVFQKISTFIKKIYFGNLFKNKNNLYPKATRIIEMI